jgi:transposase
MALKVRALTKEEESIIEQQVHARTFPSWKVTRAKIIWSAQAGQKVPEIAKRLELTEKTVRLWLKRFNELGMRGLEESARSGRPATYPPEQIAVVIETALTKPEVLEQPFMSWTLDRLEASLNEVKGIAIKRSRISEIFLAEGLGWRHEETWFGERVDPDFAQKRGPSTRSTPPRPKRVS